MIIFLVFVLLLLYFYESNHVHQHDICYSKYCYIPVATNRIQIIHSTDLTNSFNSLSAKNNKKIFKFHFFFLLCVCIYSTSASNSMKNQSEKDGIVDLIIDWLLAWLNFWLIVILCYFWVAKMNIL